MNTEREVFKRMLSTQKVELGAIDDLKKYSQGLSKYQNEGDGLLKRGNRLLSELKKLKPLYINGQILEKV